MHDPSPTRLFEPPLPRPIPDPIPGPFPESPGPLTPPIALVPTNPPIEWPIRPIRIRSLLSGCWLIRYTPHWTFARTDLFTHYDGTMRVERDGFNTIASGDLYIHNPRLFPIPFPRQQEPDPGGGIPTFPIRNYRYYLRVTQILEWITFSDTFTLEFEMHRLNQATSTWTNSGTYTANMTWKSAPVGFPRSSAYLEGDVQDHYGQRVGCLTMGWVSEYLREATVELDSVTASEVAQDNGLGASWQDTMNQVGWKINLDVSDRNVAEPSGPGWSDAELHATLLAKRDRNNLDREWRYHLLHVQQLDSTSRGIMYDAYGGDSNNIPREGAGISSHWIFPEEERWGSLQGSRFGNAAGAYYRTAVHEIGHALGLHHNGPSARIMNTTGVIASAGGGTFPNNIIYEFEADDAKKLRHWPDMRVRPGGIPFGQPYATTPLSPNDSERVDVSDHLTIAVEPLLSVVPLGAPVRVETRLTNDTNVALPMPPNLGLKAGFTRGRVIDPSGAAKDFHPLVICLDDNDPTMCEPGESIRGSMTLLRGPQGALFAAPGLHTIEVDVTWDLDGSDVMVQGWTTVMITSVTSPEHAEAAHIALDEPDLLLTLAIGGDHLRAGIDALDAAMDSDTLAPHYSVIKAKQVGRRFGNRSADVGAAAEHITEESVMSGPEILSIADLLHGTQRATRDKAPVKRMVNTLKAKAKDVAANDEVTQAIEDL